MATSLITSSSSGFQCLFPLHSQLMRQWASSLQPQQLTSYSSISQLIECSSEITFGRNHYHSRSNSRLVRKTTGQVANLLKVCCFLAFKPFSEISSALWFWFSGSVMVCWIHIGRQVRHPELDDFCFHHYLALDCWQELPQVAAPSLPCRSQFMTVEKR